MVTFLLLHSPHSFLVSEPTPAWSLRQAPLVYFSVSASVGHGCLPPCNAHCVSPLRGSRTFFIQSLTAMSTDQKATSLSPRILCPLPMFEKSEVTPWSSQSPHADNGKGGDRKGATRMCGLERMTTCDVRRNRWERPVISRKQRNGISYGRFHILSCIPQT